MLIWGKWFRTHKFIQISKKRQPNKKTKHFANKLSKKIINLCRGAQHHSSPVIYRLKPMSMGKNKSCWQWCGGLEISFTLDECGNWHCHRENLAVYTKAEHMNTSQYE